jgi:hypothetical protein
MTASPTSHFSGSSEDNELPDAEPIGLAALPGLFPLDTSTDALDVQLPLLSTTSTSSAMNNTNNTPNDMNGLVKVEDFLQSPTLMMNTAATLMANNQPHAATALMAAAVSVSMTHPSLSPLMYNLLQSQQQQTQAAQMQVLHDFAPLHGAWPIPPPRQRSNDIKLAEPSPHSAPSTPHK